MCCVRSVYCVWYCWVTCLCVILLWVICLLCEIGLLYAVCNTFAGTIILQSDTTHTSALSRNNLTQFQFKLSLLLTCTTGCIANAVFTMPTVENNLVMLWIIQCYAIMTQRRVQRFVLVQVWRRHFWFCYLVKWLTTFLEEKHDTIVPVHYCFVLLPLTVVPYMKYLFVQCTLLLEIWTWCFPLVILDELID